ncbi:dentin sialophosphoprotein [Diachasma alloeum]|uniref:dentin sialophosphoprotein n=1 Tax=Diachasma alloeum TaxID=454923 RepID=UPI0007381634|nr:dentin sialophosphoprotein [Diachasma alloeum]
MKMTVCDNTTKYVDLEEGSFEKRLEILVTKGPKSPCFRYLKIIIYLELILFIGFLGFMTAQKYFEQPYWSPPPVDHPVDPPASSDTTDNPLTPELSTSSPSVLDPESIAQNSEIRFPERPFSFPHDQLIEELKRELENSRNGDLQETDQNSDALFQPFLEIAKALENNEESRVEENEENEDNREVHDPQGDDQVSKQMSVESHEDDRGFAPGANLHVFLNPFFHVAKESEVYDERNSRENFSEESRVEDNERDEDNHEVYDQQGDDQVSKQLSEESDENDGGFSPGDNPHVLLLNPFFHIMKELEIDEERNSRENFSGESRLEDNERDEVNREVHDQQGDDQVSKQLSDERHEDDRGFAPGDNPHVLLFNPFFHIAKELEIYDEKKSRENEDNHEVHHPQEDQRDEEDQLSKQSSESDDSSYNYRDVYDNSEDDLNEDEVEDLPTVTPESRLFEMLYRLAFADASESNEPILEPSEQSQNPRLVFPEGPGDLEGSHETFIHPSSFIHQVESTQRTDDPEITADPGSIETSADSDGNVEKSETSATESVGDAQVSEDPEPANKSSGQTEADCDPESEIFIEDSTMFPAWANTCVKKYALSYALSRRDRPGWRRPGFFPSFHPRFFSDFE